MYPEEYEGHLDRIVIKREEIMKRVRQLAEEIHRDYKGRRPVLVCVLKAANAVSSAFSLCFVEHCHKPFVYHLRVVTTRLFSLTDKR